MRSQLLLKIVGLYAVLSLLALIGLLTALDVKQSTDAAAQQTEEVHKRLRSIRTDLESVDDPEIVLASWKQTLQRDGYRLWLVDSDCRALTSADDQPTAESSPVRAVAEHIKPNSQDFATGPRTLQAVVDGNSRQFLRLMLLRAFAGFNDF